MKVLILCGVFSEANEMEVIVNSKKMVEFSANVFQRKLIGGFRTIVSDCDVLSAPFIGSYPNSSKIRTFRGFSKEQNEYQYVKFHNLWGLRNFSRAAALKQEIKGFAQTKDGDKLIVVYSPHTPFLEAAVYAKRLDPNIKICLVVPDLPQYMNLSATVSALYRVGKKYDIAKFNYLSQWVDSYVLLTEYMKYPLRVGERPYIVVEGLVDSDYSKNKGSRCYKSKEYKNIVYTGKMNRRFGVCNLVDAFMQMEQPNLRLILCGAGDAQHYIRECAQQDSRICYLGQIPHAEAQEWVRCADVLVNPRPNNEEYTKYSFPSKNIEYLMSGNPTVAYMLDGMPDVYSEFLYVVQRDGVDPLKNAIQSALSASEETRVAKKSKAYVYLDKLGAAEIAARLIRLNQ